MPGSVIVGGARTPIGKLNGALAPLSASDLGGIAIKAALERAGVAPEQVDYVFMGQVILAGAGQITARQAAAKAGIPMTVPSTTVNKVCPSGLHSIYLADLMIQAGGDLAGPGQDDLAHEHVVDLLGRDAGPLEGGLDGDPTEVARREGGQGAVELPDRGAGTPHDDGSRHGVLLQVGRTDAEPV